jgi:beta-glucanase (GH16 family)
MKKNRFVLFITVFSIIILSCTEQGKEDTDKERKGWTLVWEEDFDEPLNESSWTKIPKSKNSRQKFSSKNDGLYVNQNKNLVLRGVTNFIANDTMPFLTGGVFRECFQRGEKKRVEIKARINTVADAMPYLSLIPSGGESNISINLMEQFGLDEFIYQSVSSEYTTTGRMVDNPPSIVLIGVNPNQYHIYGVEKYQDSLVFFVDGVRTRKYPRILTELPGQFPFDDVSFDLHVGVSLSKEANPVLLPVDMFIDWVRYYEPKSEPIPVNY